MPRVDPMRTGRTVPAYLPRRRFGGTVLSLLSCVRYVRHTSLQSSRCRKRYRTVAQQSSTPARGGIPAFRAEGLKD